MKNIKSFRMFEEYINNATNRLNTLFDEIIKNIKYWFSEGSFSKEGLTLYELEKSTANDYTEKNIVLDFSDGTWYYQVIIIVKLEDVKGNEDIKDGYMKIKKYDMSQEKLLRTWEDQINLENDLTEDYIIDKIAKLDDNTHPEQEDIQAVPDKDFEINDDIH